MVEIKRKNPMNKSKKKNAHLGSNSKNKKKGMKRPEGLFGNVFFYVFVFLFAYLIFVAISQNGGFTQELTPISEAINLINEGSVQNIVVSDDTIEVQLQDGSKLYSKKESSVSFDEILSNNSVDRSKIAGSIEVKQNISIDRIMSMVIFVLPLLVIFFIFKQMRGASSDVFSFGKSKARLFNKENSKITFSNVAGIKEAKQEMMEIVDFLKNPKKYLDLGARVPKGVLLVGPAGVGKTLLAKAIAGEANVPFFSVAGSEFMEMLVGVGSSRVRDLFQMARNSQPSLIFIDEIDAIGRQRGMGIGGGHDEREQTLNQILIEMDGFDPRTNVIVIAATNRPDMLDPALVRAGRFDRRIVLALPDIEERKEIFKLHSIGKPLSKEVNIEKVAKKTVGFSGADIENMLNEAAILTARDGRNKITSADIDEASLKVTIGPERRRLQTEEEKKLTAYHEGGHALVAAYVPDLDNVGRVTIVPRGGSLGHTSLPPSRDRYNETRTRLMSMIAMMLGGRVAEELIFSEITTGAANDIEKATNLARKMVVEFGMSPLGPISYNGNEETHWIAKQLGEAHKISEVMSAKIDAEVKDIIEEGYKTARNVISEHRETLNRIADALLEQETLDEDEFMELVFPDKDKKSEDAKPSSQEVTSTNDNKTETKNVEKNSNFGEDS